MYRQVYKSLYKTEHIKCDRNTEQDEKYLKWRNLGETCRERNLEDLLEIFVVWREKKC